MGDHLREAEALARTLGDQRRLARIASFMVTQCQLTGDYDEALRFGQEALAIARTLGDLSIEVVATTGLGMTHAVRGEYSAAATFLSRNVALEGDLRYERFGTSGIPSALSGADLGDVLSQLGRFDEAIRHAEAAVRIALKRPIIHIRYAGGCSTSASPTSDAGISRARSGSSSGILTSAERGSSSPTHRSSRQSWAPHTPSPVVLTRRSRWSRVLSRSFRRRPRHHWPALILLCAGMTYLSTGRIDEATSHAREALALTRRLGARGSEAHALCLVGDVASTGGTEDAPSYYREALSLADELGMRPLVAHCHLGFGKLYRRTGKREQVRDHLTIATAMYREMDMRFWLEKAEEEMRELA
jgi:tetratricopeptide (TPR) repeat protein